MNRFAWVAPRTLQEAAGAATALVGQLMTHPPGATPPAEGAVVKAGGVDLLDLLKEGLATPARLVSLKEIPDLDTIVEDGSGGLRVGAMVTLAQLARHAGLRHRHAALGEAAGAVASPQIRNVATVGGNLLQRPRCWYFRAAEYRCLRKGGGHCFALSGENQYHAIFDNRPCAIVHPSTVATALVALGATVELTSADGSTRRLQLEAFFTSPGQDLQRENDLRPREILTAIQLPAPPAGTRTAYLKQGEKGFDWPLADVAVLIGRTPDGACNSASVVLGAAAPVPHRARAAEGVLVGRRIDEALAGEAGRAAVKGATPLDKNAYKLPLFETVVRRAILRAAAAH